MRISRWFVPFVVILSMLAGAAGAQSKKSKAPDSKAKAQAKAHFDQAEIFMQAKVYDKAVEEYEKAYALVPTLHVLLFNIGLAHENGGKPDQAKEYYRKYIEADPNGPKATEAQARSIAIDRDAERARAEAERRRTEEAQRKADEEKRRKEAEETAKRIFAEQQAEKRVDKKEVDKSISWTWVGIGAAALAGGVLLDTVPATAKNQELDGTDFLPVGLYGIAGTFVYIGVF